MDIVVHPSRLEGRILAPSSKSVFQRAVAASLLSNGKTRIINPSFCNDAISALQMAGTLGATIEEDEADLLIKGGINPITNLLNPGESGLGIRMFTPIASLATEKLVMMGEGSLLSRPMSFFSDILPKLGVSCSTDDGHLPIEIQGPMKGGEITLDGSLSSQFLTGLLMALPLCENDSILHVKNLKSIPYIEMTMELMAHFGIDVQHEGFENFYITGNQEYKTQEIVVDNDWSAAAFLLVIGAIAGGGIFEVQGMDTYLTQADSAVTGPLLFSGCKLKNQLGDIQVNGHKNVGFEFDASDCPDLFPPLAAYAVFATKPSRISGISRLIHKESNRAEVIQKEFAKAGIQVELKDDDMIIHPGAVASCTIDSHNDHRIAMAAAVLALGGASITIENAECVNKSYPEFWDDLKTLGASIEKRN